MAFTMVLPTFLYNPSKVVGIPVFLAIEVLIPDNPSNLLHEKENPIFGPNPYLTEFFIMLYHSNLQPIH